MLGNHTKRLNAGYLIVNAIILTIIRDQRNSCGEVQ